jgi:hypothetical protein
VTPPQIESAHFRSLPRNRPDAPIQARRRLLSRLSADYPTLPTPLILNAVEEAEQLIRIGGDGDAERETVEIVVRHNLDLVLTAICAAKP